MLVRCPVCDDRERRAPAVGAACSRSRDGADAPPAPPTHRRRTRAVAGIPANWSRSCARSSATPRTSARRFPEEARKIHYEEVPARAIRGQASAEEARGAARRRHRLRAAAAVPDARPPLTLRAHRRCAAYRLRYNGALFGGPLAQLVEQRTFNPLVAGSNPARPTIRRGQAARIRAAPADRIAKSAPGR